MEVRLGCHEKNTARGGGGGDFLREVQRLELQMFKKGVYRWVQGGGVAEVKLGGK